MIVPPTTRPMSEAPIRISTPPAPAEDPTPNPVATASSPSSIDEERQRRRLAAIESYNLGRRLDGLPPERARMAENVRMDELPPDGDEENLCAILGDDLDEVSEHIYLANKEDIVECRDAKPPVAVVCDLIMDNRFEDGCLCRFSVHNRPQ